MKKVNSRDAIEFEEGLNGQFDALHNVNELEMDLKENTTF